MAMQAVLEDALQNLRTAISTSSNPVLHSSASYPSASNTTSDFAFATHVTFNNGSNHQTFPLTTPTRFAPDADKPIDLRTILFAWQNRDKSAVDYISSVANLNEELPGGAGGQVQNLSIIERSGLIDWLGGATQDNDNIGPLQGVGISADAEKSAAIASGKVGGVAAPDIQDKHGKAADDRLMVIYDGERRMGDHNSILKGTKPVDFSQYRVIAQTLYRKPGAPKTTSTANNLSSGHPSAGLSTPLVSNLQKPSRRTQVQPIILLSPSASSLLRMSNVKSFLDQGLFIPPNSAETSSNLNLLQLTRILPSISSTPLRFILVDSTSNFKPPYWSRVVAIFTTGQTWQFKSYKFTNPSELFNHYPGVYVGWQGEESPETVKNWGRGVLSVRVDKWTGRSEGRWRDREVVETIWARIEDSMRRHNWTYYGPGTAGRPG